MQHATAATATTTSIDVLSGDRHQEPTHFTGLR